METAFFANKKLRFQQLALTKGKEYRLHAVYFKQAEVEDKTKQRRYFFHPPSKKIKKLENCLRMQVLFI